MQVSQLVKEVTRRNGDNDYARQLKAYIAQDRMSKYPFARCLTYSLISP